jgi:outer membrane protein assembly factor BamB
VSQGCGKSRIGRLFLWIAAGALLITGGVAAFSKVDLEHFEFDPQRVEKISTAEFMTQDAGQLGPSDWPQWRGPNRNGLALEPSLLTRWPSGGPRVVWRRELGRGFSSVAIARGRLYTMDEQPSAQGPDATPSQTCEAIVCLDASNGREIWQFRYPNEFMERFGSGPRSTPAVDGDFVYAVGPTGILHCLRADTGQKVWRHDLMPEFQGRQMQYGVSFSPLVDGDLVYATPGGPNGNSVVAFDKRTGQIAWKALDDPMGYSSPIITTASGVRQLLCLTNTALVSLSPLTGELYWRYPWQTEKGFNIATPIPIGDCVFISSAYNKGCALLELTAEGGNIQPHRVYQHNRMRNLFSSSVRYGEYLYGFDQTDLVCMRVRTGEIVWREKGARSFGKGSLLVAGGHLMILGEFGILSLAEATPAGYRQMASARVSTNKCWTLPAFADGKLYVRDEGNLECLDLKQ